MVNFHDPAVIVKEFTALLNFVHCLDGIFIWELFVSLKFDWDHFTGKRKFKWTFVLYFISRISTLGSIICTMILSSNFTHPINCQLWNTWNLILGYTACACASVLMALRVIAIWSPSRFVAAVTIATCLTNIGFLIYGVATIHSTWSPIGACVLENTFQIRDTITVVMATDITLLIIMLVGVLRSRQRNYGIIRHLYIQGLIWVTAATVAEVPAAVFINLNLNDPWNLMFQNFAFFTMVICATRMYRVLIDSDTEVEKYNSSPTVLSRLRFGGSLPKGMTVSDKTDTSNSALQKSHFEVSYPRAEDVELNLTERTVAIGDEEAQSHKMPFAPMRTG